jgi:hypothetical protein
MKTYGWRGGREGMVRVVAEVSDKIPSVWFFWCFHLVAAAVVLVLTRRAQRRAALVLLLPLAIAWAAFFAYIALEEDPLGDVTGEMGRTYYIQQAVAALLPVGAVVVGRAVSVHRGRSNWHRAEDGA